MIIYNVTIKVESTIAAEWVQWLQTEHIPEILATGCFEDATVLHLLEPVDEEGTTYAVQYKAKDIIHYERYINQYAQNMRNKGFEKWGNRFIAFRSLMKVIH